MKATEVLMHEHRVIERVLDGLEAAAARLELGRAVRPGLFAEAAGFFSGFADGCHHRKEEQVLFPAMLAHGIPDRGGPIGVMTEEHARGRALLRDLRDAAGRLAARDADARAELAIAVRGYVALMRRHIDKEDAVLFPMAERVLPEATRDAVADGFARLERDDADPDLHEHYLALADRLRRELGA